MRNSLGKQKRVLVLVRKYRDKINLWKDWFTKSWNLIKKCDISLKILEGHWVCFWICLSICFCDLTLPIAFQFRLILILTIKLGETLVVYRIIYHQITKPYVVKQGSHQKDTNSTKFEKSFQKVEISAKIRYRVNSIIWSGSGLIKDPNIIFDFKNLSSQILKAVEFFKNIWNYNFP